MGKLTCEAVLLSIVCLLSKFSIIRVKKVEMYGYISSSRFHMYCFQPLSPVLFSSSLTGLSSFQRLS